MASGEIHESTQAMASKEPLGGADFAHLEAVLDFGLKTNHVFPEKQPASKPNSPSSDDESVKLVHVIPPSPASAKNKKAAKIRRVYIDLESPNNSTPPLITVSDELKQISADQPTVLDTAAPQLNSTGPGLPKEKISDVNLVNNHGDDLTKRAKEAFLQALEKSHDHLSGGSDDSGEAEDRDEKRQHRPAIVIFPPDQESLNQKQEQYTMLENFDVDKLIDKQKEAFDAAMNGENVFVTGVGGTGKTFLIKLIQHHLNKRFKNDPTRNIGIVSPTGITAIAINGNTINSFFKIGIPKFTSDFFKVSASKKGIKLVNIAVLIIDEISMVSAEMLEMLNQTLILHTGRPLGSDEMQLLVFGDFFQLPPVASKYSVAEVKKDEPNGLLFYNRGMAFQSDIWWKCNLRYIELTESYRQKDKHFVDILNKVRVGDTSQEVLSFLNGLSKPLDVSNNILPTFLHCKNIDVDQINQTELQKLPGELVTYKAIDTTYFPEKNLDLKDHIFFKNNRASALLELKVGAQVMLIVNVDTDAGLVNGSRGVIDNFEKATGRPAVKLQNGSLVLVNLHDFEYEYEKDVILRRKQYPLSLAWALTIHKSQGMSLDKVETDLSGAFASGQSYVALSRARAPEGLRIIKYIPYKIKADPSVAKFYEMMHRYVSLSLSGKLEEQKRVLLECQNMFTKYKFNNKEQVNRMEILK